MDMKRDALAIAALPCFPPLDLFGVIFPRLPPEKLALWVVDGGRGRLEAKASRG